MHVEQILDDDEAGPAWIGRITFSKTGRTLYARGRALQLMGGEGSDYVDQATGERFRLSNVKRDLQQRRFPGYGDVEVDPEAVEEYERLLAAHRR
jgi:Fe-S cluster assembly iron-binding protein IscA